MIGKTNTKLQNKLLLIYIYDCKSRLNAKWIFKIQEYKKIKYCIISKIMKNTPSLVAVG